MKIVEIVADVPNTLVLLNANCTGDVYYIKPKLGLFKTVVQKLLGGSQKPIFCWDEWYCRNIGYLPAELSKLAYQTIIEIDGAKVVLYAIDDVQSLICKPRAPVVSYT